VRQTVFDWLSSIIECSAVLDLFAGSGALGLEAISRGAAHASFAETGGPQAAAIRAAVTRLKVADRCDVIRGDGISFLRSTPRR
ncbi:RsmD family RNA methyltransferase, partial [Escherichia coli]|uniref:RsmD family RNA methyltransferase n=1 Tax=Escherichia coli TaxID=562 RepID=UPI0021185197